MGNVGNTSSDYSYWKFKPSSFVNTTATTAVKNTDGILTGIFVASVSGSPTIKLWNNTSATATVLVNTFTPVAATFYSFPDVYFSTALFMTVGATADITVFYK
jgi:hypothetical protein